MVLGGVCLLRCQDTNCKRCVVRLGLREEAAVLKLKKDAK